MIVSASRRTDIPAFYGRWFLNRLRQGFALVRNPFNQALVYRVPLDPRQVRCLVFWTKDPRDLLERLDELDSYGLPYYFLFTLTAYGAEIERNLAEKRVIRERFVRLSERLGAERVVWRYDPIFFTPTWDIERHLRHFELLASALRGYTRRCVISVLTMYKKCRKNLKDIEFLSLPAENRQNFFRELAAIAAGAGIELRSCASAEPAAAGIPPSKCIDDDLISEITGTAFVGTKDRCQRAACGCVESVDIGAYDTCLHHCLYCYANSNLQTARRRYALHDPDSPLLCGRPAASDRILERVAAG
jgi:hypothetical protein